MVFKQSKNIKYGILKKKKKKKKREQKDDRQKFTGKCWGFKEELQSTVKVIHSTIWAMQVLLWFYLNMDSKLL